MKNILTVQQQKDDFDQNANNFKSWFSKAAALHYSAKELFKIYDNTRKEMQQNGSGSVPISFFISDQVLLLEGFAIECSLKGLYIADGGKIAEDGKIKNSLAKKSHKLLSWCELTNTELNDREKILFKTLSLIIASYGRYPVPMKYEDNPLERTKEQGYKPRYIWSHDDIVLIDNFIISILWES
jgi:hypothetical protein